jgi:hypothetical protein
MVWFRNNKAAQKWTEEQVEAIFIETYEWLKAGDGVKLVTEMELHMLETHSVGVDTWRSWVNNIYKDNKCIQHVMQAINLILENRVTYDKESMRPGVQLSVLQNKHDHREKKDTNLSADQSLSGLFKNVKANTQPSERADK